VPEYNIVFGNRTYIVELVKKEGKQLFDAKINDKPVEFEVKETKAGAISPLTIKIAEKTYQIELEKINRHAPFTLKVNDVLLKAQLREPVKRLTTQTPTMQVAARTERLRGAVVNEGTVVAPMAGKIVSVKVKKGDAVKAGDVVCILEAMKMENEITATKAGKVQEINVAEGTPVNDGDTLVIIK
jgi:biotin carboxyl carrier protein